FKRPMHINDYERLSYYGGRTEVFNYNTHDAFYEDIKSSYPNEMKHKEFPFPNQPSLLENQDWEEIRNSEGVSLVRIHVPYMHVPPLPYRRPQDGKLIFPYGTWTAAYTHPELRMAEKYGCKVLEVFHSLTYHKTFKPFESFVDHFYPLKDQTTGLRRDLNKLVMNGLSGKFGEKREVSINGTQETLQGQICCCSADQKSINQSTNTCENCGQLDILGCHVTEHENGWIS